MENEVIKAKPTKDRRGVWTGILLLIIGGVLLAKQTGAPIPAWVFNWHVLLIALGFFVGLRSSFRNPIWLIMILIGSFFTIEDFYPALSVHQYIWPLAIIGAGLFVIFRPRHRKEKIWWEQWEEQHKSARGEERRKARREQREKYTEAYGASDISGEDYIDVVSVLGGIKKNILSKNFKGGEVISFLGGTELNLSQADINGRVVLDLTQVLGGTKLIVPPHWDLKPELISVFGSIDDKRSLENVVVDPNKVLVLKGTSVLGGIDIRSY
jgi:hypothetical protein